MCLLRPLPAVFAVAMFAASPTSAADSTACCNEQTGPNTPAPGGPEPGPGGGRIGAVVLSPCIRPGTVDETAHNHYSLLRTAEDGLGLSHLGYAGQAGLEPIGSETFTRSDCHERIHLAVRPKYPPAGERVRVRVRVTSRYARCRRDVIVELGGKQAKTNARGRASLFARFGEGAIRTKASRPGCVSDNVLISPRRK